MLIKILCSEDFLLLGLLLKATMLIKPICSEEFLLLGLLGSYAPKPPGALRSIGALGAMFKE